MSTLDDKIIEEIKRRVLERDQELKKEKEQQSVEDATKEALVEVTSLSKKEVEEISQQVEKELREKQAVIEKQRRERIENIKKYLIYAGLVLIVVGLIVYSKTRKKKPTYTLPQTTTTTTETKTFSGTFIEKFDDNRNNWSLYQDYKFRNYFDKGAYVVENNDEEYGCWDFLTVQLPTDYIVELTSVWKKGKFKGYGLVLLENNERYAHFQLQADGAATFCEKIDTRWVENSSWLSNRCKEGDGKTANVQKVIVKGNTFEYFVNDKFVSDGSLHRLDIAKVGMLVHNKQVVNFKELKVTDLKGKVIFEDTFDQPDKRWKPDSSSDRRSWINNGKFNFESRKDDWCYWGTLKFELAKKSEVSVDVKWEKGEDTNFGLMVGEDDDNYLACEMKSNGETRFVERRYGKYTVVPNYQKTKFVSDGTKSFRQTVKIENGTVSYYLENVLIGTTRVGVLKLNQINLRCCGRQTVSFDNLSIKQ